MGVERAVTRWHLQHQAILSEIATLQAKLAEYAQAQDKRQEPTSDTQQVDSDLMQQLAHAQEKLRTLGPCPKPMMG